MGSSSGNLILPIDPLRPKGAISAFQITLEYFRWELSREQGPFQISAEYQHTTAIRIAERLRQVVMCLDKGNEIFKSRTGTQVSRELRGLLDEFEREIIPSIQKASKSDELQSKAFFGKSEESLGKICSRLEVMSRIEELNAASLKV